MSKKKFTTKMTYAIEPPAPTYVWGYKGVPGKGGKTKNAVITANVNKKETD